MRKLSEHYVLQSLTLTMVKIIKTASNGAALSPAALPSVHQTSVTGMRTVPIAKAQSQSSLDNLSDMVVSIILKDRIEYKLESCLVFYVGRDNSAEMKKTIRLSWVLN